MRKKILVYKKDRMERRRILLPLYYSRGKQVCTTVTATYFKISQAEVQLEYGNHSRPAIIEITKQRQLSQIGNDKVLSTDILQWGKTSMHNDNVILPHDKSSHRATGLRQPLQAVNNRDMEKG